MAFRFGCQKLVLTTFDCSDLMRINASYCLRAIVH
jgi:hypothetical protein